MINRSYRANDEARDMWELFDQLTKLCEGRVCEATLRIYGYPHVGGPEAIAAHMGDTLRIPHRLSAVSYTLDIYHQVRSWVISSHLQFDLAQIPEPQVYL